MEEVGIVRNLLLSKKISVGSVLSALLVSVVLGPAATALDADNLSTQGYLGTSYYGDSSEELSPHYLHLNAGGGIIGDYADGSQPMVWPVVIRILGSKPACEAARDFYNSKFPDYPKLKCRKSGKVWLLTR
ncbi:MAG: hypothetical protein Q3965_01890 [Rothia sp. (in: high G+C Gram-positive bacteria)]|nr:hypothetical protein [Rothia sp. (in: high G+C Gram-positive bacteria)]